MLPSTFSQPNLTSTQAPAQAPAPAPAPASNTPQLPYPHNPDSFGSAPFQQPTYAQGPTPPEKVLTVVGGLPSPVNNVQQQHLPPLKPVFGVSLDELYERDGTAVPMIVYQCFQAIELFGLDMEGIYRLSGSATQIAQMKSLFDNGELTTSSLVISSLTGSDRFLPSGFHEPGELPPRREQRSGTAQTVLQGLA